MITGQQIHNICFSDSQLQSINPSQNVSNFNRPPANDKSVNGNTQMNLDTLCEKVFINNEANANLNGKQLFNSQAQGDAHAKRVQSLYAPNTGFNYHNPQQMQDLNRINTQQYHDQGSLMKMMNEEQRMHMHQMHLNHHQESKIYQNQQPSMDRIGRVSPHYNRQVQYMFNNIRMPQDELQQVFLRIDNLDGMPNERNMRDEMDKFKLQNQQGSHFSIQNKFPKIIDKKERKQTANLQLPSSQLFKEKNFRQAPPYQYMFNSMNLNGLNQCSPYINGEFREKSRSPNWTGTKIPESSGRFSIGRSGQRASPIHRHSNLPVARGKFQQIQIQRDSSNLRLPQGSHQISPMNNNMGSEQQNIICAAQDIIQVLTPILKNVQQSQTKSHERDFHKNCGKTISTCKETLMPYESAHESMKRNQEYLIQRQPKIQLQSHNRLTNCLSISPRIVNHDKDAEEMKSTLINNKQHANLTSVQKIEKPMHMPRARYVHSYKQSNEKESEAEKGLFQLQAQEIHKEQIVYKDNETQDQTKEQDATILVANQSNLKPQEISTINEKINTNKCDKFNGTRVKQNKKALKKKMNQQQEQETNESPEKLTKLGKRKNKKSDLKIQSKKTESKKLRARGNSPNQLISNNNDKINDSLQSQTEQILFGSSLGLALSKIGIKIGNETGATLNNFIKKKIEKNGNANSVSASLEEKNLEKQKKSKQTKNKCDQSNMNKKRNKKQMQKADKTSEVILASNYDQNEDDESSDFTLKHQYQHKSQIEAI